MVTETVVIEGLSVALSGRPVLNDVDLRANAGEWVNIVGPNGAGKTTLLRAVLGLVQGTGTIAVGSHNSSSAMERARTMAFVPQSPVIPPGMLVADYVLLGRTPHRGVFTGDSQRDIDVASATLSRLDLDGLATRELTSLSGGERQRAVLARALAQEAPVLLLDEPTTALDLGHQQDVLELIDQLRHDTDVTVIATLHDLTLAARYGDRVAMLSNGRFVSEGAPSDVLTAEAIADVFGARVRIVDDPGGPVIVPVT